MTLLLLNVLYPCSPMLLSYDSPPNLSADVPVLPLLFPLKLNNLSYSPAQNVDCDWCPITASLPLMLMPSIFTIVLLLLSLSLQRGHFILLSIPVVVSDTRCCCAAAVLC